MSIIMSERAEKAQLRKTLRERRQNLTPHEQRSAAKCLVKQAGRYFLNPPKRIAVYLTNDGEMNMMPLIERYWRIGVDVYLPVVHARKRTLSFKHYRRDTQLIKNRFGIAEPTQHKTIAIWQLSAVFMPLVGFDAAGGRLGMGGGYYDRTFAHAWRWPKQPLLIGVAHECQKVSHIPNEPWDINMHAILTDQHSYRINAP